MPVKRGPGRPRKQTLSEIKAAQAQNNKSLEEVGLGEGRITNNLRELKRLYQIKMNMAGR